MGGAVWGADWRRWVPGKRMNVERAWGTGEDGGGKEEAEWVPEKVGGHGKG